MIGLALVLSLLASDDLTPEKAAKVQRDREKALADVAKKYGNKKSSELSNDERREMIQDQRAAESAVLDSNNVDPKEFARYEARMTLADRDATKTEKARLEKKEEDDKKAAEQKDKPQDVQVQRGFSDSNPVVLEEKSATGAPVVEKGLPQDAQDDQAQASGGKEPQNDSAAPAKKSGKSKK